MVPKENISHVVVLGTVHALWASLSRGQLPRVLKLDRQSTPGSMYLWEVGRGKGPVEAEVTEVWGEFGRVHAYSSVMLAYLAVRLFPVVQRTVTTTGTSIPTA